MFITSVVNIGWVIDIVQIYCLTFSIILANTSASYIVGLAYYQLGEKHIDVDMSAAISNNTALIITLYKAYNPNANINITGPGRENIKIIIWATYLCPLYSFSNFLHKHIPYPGYNIEAVNKVVKPMLFILYIHHL